MAKLLDRVFRVLSVFAFFILGPLRKLHMDVSSSLIQRAHLYNECFQILVAPIYVAIVGYFYMLILNLSTTVIFGWSDDNFAYNLLWAWENESALEYAVYMYPALLITWVIYGLVTTTVMFIRPNKNMPWLGARMCFYALAHYIVLPIALFALLYENYREILFIGIPYFLLVVMPVIWMMTIPSFGFFGRDGLIHRTKHMSKEQVKEFVAYREKEEYLNRHKNLGRRIFVIFFLYPISVFLLYLVTLGVSEMLR